MGSSSMKGRSSSSACKWQEDFFFSPSHGSCTRASSYDITEAAVAAFIVLGFRAYGIRQQRRGDESSRSALNATPDRLLDAVSADKRVTALHLAASTGKLSMVRALTSRSSNRRSSGRNCKHSRSSSTHGRRSKS